MKVDDKTLQALAMAVKFREMRQGVITSNIANSETPGYKSKDLDFEKALARALDVDGQQSLKATNDKHFNVGSGGFENLEPEIFEEATGVVSDDGNTVDPEKEQLKMAENKLLYDAAVQLLNKKLAMKRYAIESEK